MDIAVHSVFVFWHISISVLGLIGKCWLHLVFYDISNLFHSPRYEQSLVRWYVLHTVVYSFPLTFFIMVYIFCLLAINNLNVIHVRALINNSYDKTTNALMLNNDKVECTNIISALLHFFVLSYELLINADMNYIIRQYSTNKFNLFSLTRYV